MDLILPHLKKMVSPKKCSLSLLNEDFLGNPQYINILYNDIAKSIITFRGQKTISVTSIFSILILTSKTNSVYPGSPKNTFFQKNLEF